MVIVDRAGRATGTHDKLDAHRVGLRHLAISVFIFNGRGELLLQKRAPGKYHCGGLWSNTCCGHPMLDELSATAASRRLRDELGLCCELSFFREFRYRLSMPNGLIENEHVSVFLGQSEDHGLLNPREVTEVRWCGLPDIQIMMMSEPEAFTPWFRLYIKRFGDHLIATA